MFLLEKKLIHGKRVNDVVVHNGLLYIGYAGHVEIRDVDYIKKKHINLPVQQLVIYKNKVYGLLKQELICLDEEDSISLDQDYNQVVVAKNALVFISRCRIVVIVDKSIKFSRNIVSEMISGHYCLEDDICVLSRNGIEFYKCQQSLKPYKSIVMDYSKHDHLKMFNIPNSKLMVIYDGNIRLASPSIDISKPFPHIITCFALIPMTKHRLDVLYKILFCTMDGDYFYLHIYEADFEIEFVCKYVIASSITCFQGFVFIGSHYHSSILCILHPSVVDGSIFEPVQSISSLAPITQLNLNPITTISHAYPTEAMSIHQGIPFHDFGTIETLNIPQSVFTLDNLIFLSFPSSTVVFEYKNDSIEAIEHPSSCNESTLFVKQIKDSIYQCTPSGLYKINKQRELVMSLAVSCACHNMNFYLFGQESNSYCVFKDGTLIYSSNHPFHLCCTDHNMIILYSDQLYVTDLNFQSVLPLGYKNINSIQYQHPNCYIGYIDGSFNVLNIESKEITFSKSIGNIPVTVYAFDEHVFVTSDTSYYFNNELVKVNLNLVFIAQLMDFFFIVTHQSYSICQLGEINKFYIEPHGPSDYYLPYKDYFISICGNSLRLLDQKQPDQCIQSLKLQKKISCCECLDAIYVGYPNEICKIEFSPFQNAFSTASMELSETPMFIQQLNHQLVVCCQTECLLIENGKIIDKVDKFTQIVSLDCYNSSIYIGDVIRSVFVYEIQNDQFVALKRDGKPKWTMCSVGLLDGVLIGDDHANVYWMNKDVYLKSIQGFWMGDTINTMKRMAIVGNKFIKQEAVYYGTIGGTLGVFYALDDVVFMIIYLVYQFIIEKRKLTAYFFIHIERSKSKRKMSRL